MQGTRGKRDRRQSGSYTHGPRGRRIRKTQYKGGNVGKTRKCCVKIREDYPGTRNTAKTGEKMLIMRKC